MERAKAQPLKDRLLTPIQFVKGIGPKLAKLFEKKGILTVEDAMRIEEI
jgi:predicted flap endonuclease-1-like 5' DNA nuclease